MSAINEYLEREKTQPDLYDDEGWKLLEQARVELKQLTELIDRQFDDIAALRAAAAERDAFAELLVENNAASPTDLRGVISSLRADLQAETQRADVLSSARNRLAAELQAARQRIAIMETSNREMSSEVISLHKRIAALEIRNKELEDYHGLYMGIPPADTSTLEEQSDAEREEIISQHERDAQRGLLDAWHDRM